MKLIKTKTTVVLFTVLALWSCQKEKDFTITMKFDQIGQGKIYLEREITADSIVTDSIEIIDSMATFNGKIAMPELFFLRLNNEKRKVPLFIEPGNITVNFSSELPDIYTVTGSSIHGRYDRFMDHHQEFVLQENQLYKEYQNAKQENNREQLNKISKQLDEVENRRLQFCQNYVDTTTDLVSLFVLRRYLVYTTDYNALKKYLERYDKGLHNSGMYQTLSKRLTLLEKAQEGAIAPDFTLENVDGQNVSLSDFRGSYLLIDFWASWCSPCREANPHLVEIYKKYNPKGFKILGVSLDKNREKWIEAIKQDNLTWEHVSDLNGWKNAAAQLYGVNSIPHATLIGTDGKIIAYRIEPEALEKKLSEIYKE